MNYSLSIDLTSIPGATLQQSPTTGKLAIILPIEESDLFMSNNNKVYLNLNMWEKRTPDQWNKTHGLKQALSKQRREALGDAAKMSPFIGSAKEIQVNRQGGSQYPTMPQSFNPNKPDDLAF